MNPLGWGTGWITGRRSSRAGKSSACRSRALANRPSVIFADEPTANLDSTQSENLLGLIRALRDEHDTTIVVVTHHLGLEGDADRVVEMRDGKIARDAPTDRAQPVSVSTE